MKERKNKAFTLVELIIVITILIILAIVAFLTLWEYTAQTRDSVRIADMQNIEKALSLNNVETWKFLDPEKIAKTNYSLNTLASNNTWIIEEEQTWNIYLWEPERETCERNIPWRFIVDWQMITDTRTWLLWSK